MRQTDILALFSQLEPFGAQSSWQTVSRLNSHPELFFGLFIFSSAYLILQYPLKVPWTVDLRSRRRLAPDSPWKGGFPLREPFSLLEQSLSVFSPSLDALT